MTSRQRNPLDRPIENPRARPFRMGHPALESESSLSMDAPTAQENPVVDPPRHLFFGAEDRRQGGRAGLDDKYVSMEKARRHQLAEQVIITSNQLASAVRTLRAFDRTGNADMALDHIEQTFADLKKHTDNLVNEVNGSVDRYGDELEKLAFRDIAAAREATDAQTPKPGPAVSHKTFVRVRA